jgi:hypothetical protein
VKPSGKAKAAERARQRYQRDRAKMLARVNAYDGKRRRARLRDARAKLLPGGCSALRMTTITLDVLGFDCLDSYLAPLHTHNRP